jgi:hypothetical protein
MSDADRDDDDDDDGDNGGDDDDVDDSILGAGNTWSSNMFVL